MTFQCEKVRKPKIAIKVSLFVLKDSSCFICNCVMVHIELLDLKRFSAFDH